MTAGILSVLAHEANTSQHIRPKLRMSHKTLVYTFYLQLIAMNIILHILLPILCWARGMCLSFALVLLSMTSSQALDLPHDQPVSPATQRPLQPSMALPPLLAQGSLDGPAQRFAQWVRPILTLVALVMVVAAGFAIGREGNPEKAIYLLLGAFILLLAWFIVNSLVSAAQ